MKKLLIWITILILAVICFFGGKKLYNSYQQKKNSPTVSEEKRWAEHKEALNDNLQILNNPAIKLWEAQEVYQTIRNLPLSSNSKNMPENIVQIYDKIYERCAEIYKEFGGGIGLPRN